MSATLVRDRPEHVGPVPDVARVTPIALALVRAGTPVTRAPLGWLGRLLRRRARQAPVAGVPVPAAPAGVEAAVVAGLGEEECRLLAWLEERVPASEVAAWVAGGHGPVRTRVRMRVLRLRERLRDVVRRHAATLPPDERVALEGWLRAPARDAARPVSARPPAATR